MDYLYHYFDASTGPFCNLSDLDVDEAERVLDNLRRGKIGFAGKRSEDYMAVRRQLERKARELFIAKGGLPQSNYPHYMTLGESPWLLEWYPSGRQLKIPVADFDPLTVSFTYGDLFPTMRFQDDKPYRRQVYTLEEIDRIIARYGYPQEWNADGSKGPERYIEAQIWQDGPLQTYRKACKEE